MVIDSHAHLDDRAFDEDREKLLEQIKKSGIEYVINISASLASIETSMELAKKYDFIYSTVGVHPSETGELNEENFNLIRERLTDKKVVAVGEIGLDYYWNEPEKQIQHKWFRRQLGLAREYRLPVVIHSRDAAADTYRILEEEKAHELGGIIHCYSYSKETARDYLKLGYYFGIGGVITFQNAKKLKEAVEYIPIEQIVLETDCPYLSPTPYRGKRNTPLNLPIIADTVAKLKGMDVERVIEITAENTKKLYRIA